MSLYEESIYKLRYSAIPLLLFWGAVIAALAYANIELGAPRWLLLLLTAPAAFMALLHVYHGYMRLSWAARTYRRHLPRLMLRMLVLLPKLSRARVEIAKILVHIALTALAILLAILYNAFSLLALGCFFAGITLTAILRVFLPPGAVYLASSQPERISYFANLNKRTILGIAALLEVSTHAKPQEGFARFYGIAIGLLNDYRTSDPDEWTNVVARLVEMTALVIVDGRDNTPGVRYEVQRLLRNRLDFKTAFLSIDGSLPPVLVDLNAKSTHPSGQFQVISHDLAAQAVPKIIANAPMFWIPVTMDA